MKLGQIHTGGFTHSLRNTSKVIARALEQLSTGLRVRAPADDPSAFSQSVRLDSQTRGLRQSVQNINLEMNALQTKDVAVESQINIVQKMRELAIQGLNSNLSSGDRQNINNELQSLMDEFQRAGEESAFGVDEFKKTSGTGKFRYHTEFDTDDNTLVNETGDFDGDGHTDFITASQDSGTISVFFGNGDGTFFQITTQSAPSAIPNNVKVSDLNQDGRDDIVFSNFGGPSHILLSTGRGAFQQGQTFAYSYSIALDDMNGDGHIDLIRGNEFDISVHFGKGDGTFEHSPASIKASATSHLTLTGDFDGDGNRDIMTNDYHDDKVRLHFGNGDGTTRTAIEIGSVATLMAAGDFNNDGRTDVFTDDSVWLSDGDGTFTNVNTQPMAFGGLGDFNNDGNLDVVGSLGGTGRIWLGNGAGAFEQGQTHGAGVIDAAVADYNEDGVLDFANTDGGTESFVWLGVATERTSLSDMNVSNLYHAKEMLKILDMTMATLLNERASIAMNMEGLEFRVSQEMSLRETLEEARANLASADYGESVSELTRAQIQQQAQLAALSQANIHRRAVLDLLKFN